MKSPLRELHDRRREEALERGHRLIHCRVHNYRGWSDDCGHCPYCEDNEREVTDDDE
jgi:hypothetical protein